MTDDLGKMPDAVAEESEPAPGGVDSADNPKYGYSPDEPTTPDGNPSDNPAVDDVSPAELREPEVTNEGASTDGASEPESETPA